MGFEFSDHKVNLEIGEKTYEVEMGDADLLDRIQEWGGKLQSIDYEKVTEGAMRLLEHDVRGYLVAMLGEEQLNSIFSEGRRRFNLIDAMELFAYIYEQVMGSNAYAGFEKRMSKYLPDTD